jgi:hypothetical protein
VECRWAEENWWNFKKNLLQGHIVHHESHVMSPAIEPKAQLSVGWDSSVGIATRYGLDCSGIEFRWCQDFPHPSRLVLGPTQPPIQWAPGLFTPMIKWSRRGVNHPPQSSAEVREGLELYLYSTSGPLWPLLGRTLPLSISYCTELNLLSSCVTNCNCQPQQSFFVRTIFLQTIEKICFAFS